MSLPQKQPPFSPVKAGGVSSITRLDMGDTCDALILKLSGKLDATADVDFVVAHLEQIFVKLGGKKVVDGLSGPELQTYAKYMELPNGDHYLLIPFADLRARTIVGQDMGSIDTSLGYSSFSMTVHVADAANTDGQPELECWMLKSAPKEDESLKPMFRAFLRADEHFASAKTHSLSPALGSEDGNLINRILVMTPNNRISQLDVRKNGIEIQGDGEKGVMEFIQSTNRTTQNGVVVYDPEFDNNQSNAVSTIKRNGRPASIDFRARFTAAESVVEISDIYTVIDRI